ERQEYAIDNYLISSEQICQRIVRNALRYITAQEANMLHIAIREMLINAVEHGNLNIGYEEKTQAMADNRYFEFLKQRQKDPACREKRVTIEYMINSSRMACKITDEGNGFDHERIIQDDGDRANADFLSHGRGISMTKEIFDEIRYNKKGNQVLLVKNFRK
ncbi:MAG: ATP-binding protein, partial [Spirochaetota bacterium]